MFKLIATSIVTTILLGACSDKPLKQADYCSSSNGRLICSGPYLKMK